MLSPISFKAKYISRHQIKQRNNNNSINVNMVQIDPMSEKDIQSIRTVNSIWENGCTYADDILDDLYEYVETNLPHKVFFALTTQKKDFQELIPEKILGLGEVLTEPNSDKIKFKRLQTTPKEEYQNPKRSLTGIGKALLSGIKTMFPVNIILESDKDAKGFYLKNGFEFIGKKKSLSMIFKH